MNKIVKAVGLAALAAIVVVTVASCNLVGMSVSGKVVNVRAPANEVQFWKGTTVSTATLIGAEITLTNKKNGDISRGTVEDDGTYVISGVSAGKYTLSGTNAGWSFVEREVDITGFFSTMPDVLAFETLTDPDDILVMVEWGNTAMDVDAYMTRDTNGGTYDGVLVAGFASGLTSNVQAGYTLETRQLGQYFHDNTGNVVLERDITQVGGNTLDNISDEQDALLPRVETIIVKEPSGAVETLRYYIRLFNQVSGTSLTGYPGASADATVFVVQGTTNLGAYRIAVNSAEMVLGVLQMEWDNGAAEWTIASYSNPYFDSGDGTTLGGVRSLADGVVEVSAIK